jgi:hypothetical protein
MSQPDMPFRQLLAAAAEGASARRAGTAQDSSMQQLQGPADDQGEPSVCDGFEGGRVWGVGHITAVGAGDEGGSCTGAPLSVAVLGDREREGGAACEAAKQGKKGVLRLIGAVLRRAWRFDWSRSACRCNCASCVVCHRWFGVLSLGLLLDVSIGIPQAQSIFLWGPEVFLHIGASYKCLRLGYRNTWAKRHWNISHWNHSCRRFCAACWAVCIGSYVSCEGNEGAEARDHLCVHVSLYIGLCCVLDLTHSAVQSCLGWLLTSMSYACVWYDGWTSTLTLRMFAKCKWRL